MSSNTATLDEVELPHNAWLDSTTGTVSFAIDRMTLTFTINEFSSFAGQIEDIALVLSQMIQQEEAECPTCGTTIESTYLAPPADEDYN